MKKNNNEQIVFDMFEEVATESIAEARNVYTPMKKLMGAIRRRKRLLIMQGRTCWRKWKVHKNKTPTEAGV